jgi:hypothetical protein
MTEEVFQYLELFIKELVEVDQVLLELMDQVLLLQGKVYQEQQEVQVQFL